jgi:hypothetical protein
LEKTVVVILHYTSYVARLLVPDIKLTPAKIHIAWCKAVCFLIPSSFKALPEFAGIIYRNCLL